MFSPPLLHAIPRREASPVQLSCLFILTLVLEFTAPRDGAAQGGSPQRVSESRFFELLDEGAVRADEGDEAGALGVWLAAFDGSRGVPGLEEARLTLALDALVALGESYDPAMKALIERRNAAERRLVETRGAIEDADEIVALNGFLSGPERSLAVYDRYRARRDADPEITLVLRDLLWSDLAEAGRYGELADEAAARAKELIPAMDHAREAMERYERELAEGGAEGGTEHDSPPGAPEGETSAEGAGEIWHDEISHGDGGHGDEDDLIGEALDLYEILLGARREPEALKLAEAILRLEPEAREALAEAQQAGR